MSGIEEIETEVNTCMAKSSSFINPFEWVKLLLVIIDMTMLLVKNKKGV